MFYYDSINTQMLPMLPRNNTDWTETLGLRKLCNVI